MVYNRRMAKPSSNRREFLQGKSAQKAISAAVDYSLAAGEPAESDSTPHSYQIQLRRQAMACEFAVYLNAGQYADGSEVALRALDLVDELESQLTVYRDTSEVSAINRAAADGPVEVEPRLFDLLCRSIELFEATEGAFDITAGPLVKLWGFFRRQGRVPAEDDLTATMDRIGSQHVQLDRDARTIQFLKTGVEINLGSIGKGYALDRCDELMREAGINDFLWHGGQSSVWARGTSGEVTGPRRGWCIGVADPLNSTRRLAEIWLRDQALATSGAAVQFFRHNGKRYGHILDPRTGWPAEGVFSATVVAPTAAEADALATAFYVLGIDRTAAYCEQHPGVGAVITYPSSTGSKVELAKFGLEADQWKRLEGT